MTKSTDDGVTRMKKVELEPASRLKTGVWWMRRSIRDVLGGRDILDVDTTASVPGLKIKHVYKKADEFVTRYFPGLTKTTTRSVATRRLLDAINDLEYTIVEANEEKPWGAYYRLDSAEADRFIAEFFPGLNAVEARLGNPELELSPKFLLVAPDQRLSWQLHHRRAERWRFLNTGAYYKSLNNTQGERVEAKPGDVVQFQKGERHRLCAFDKNNWTLVAEIWQHVDPSMPSNEEDIVRLQDDYKR